MESIKRFIFSKIEMIALDLRYDFILDEEFTLIGQIVERDESGSVTETPLSFECQINEENGEGKFFFYQSEGEVKRADFSISRPDTIAAILTFIQQTLKNRKDM